MEMKNFFVFIIILIICISSSFWGGMKYSLYRVPNDYAFFNSLPILTEKEHEIVRNTFGKALLLLDEPGGWYVSDVKVSDSTYILKIAKLSHLQSSSNSKGTHIGITMDGSHTFRFSKDYDMLTDTTELDIQKP
jgi:hypothetical protein